MSAKATPIERVELAEYVSASLARVFGRGRVAIVVDGNSNRLTVRPNRLAQIFDPDEKSEMSLVDLRRRPIQDLWGRTFDAVVIIDRLPSKEAFETLQMTLIGGAGIWLDFFADDTETGS